MRISVAALTLRFYKCNGWTRLKVRKLLVNPHMEVTYRQDENKPELQELLGDLSYYAVYTNSGQKVFKKSEMDKHTFEDRGNFGGVGWYIDEEN